MRGAAVELCAGPVVVPDAGRQVDLVGRDLFRRGDGGDEDVGAEEELAAARRGRGDGRRSVAWGNSRKSGRMMGRPVREVSSAAV